MAVDVLLAERRSGWSSALWLISALVLGPLAVGIYAFSHNRRDWDRIAIQPRAWETSALIIPGYALGWTLAISLLINLGEQPHPLATLSCTYLLPLFAGLCLVRLPLLVRQYPGSVTIMFPKALLSEFITWNFGYAVFFPLTNLISQRMLTTMPGPSSPFFWAMISSVSVAGVVILVPLQAWMHRRGLGLPSGSTSALTAKPSLLDQRTGRLALLTSLAILIASLAITITQMD
jgi:hypothetical protein